jgi:hypothetical protein
MLAGRTNEQGDSQLSRHLFKPEVIPGDSAEHHDHSARRVPGSEVLRLRIRLDRTLRPNRDLPAERYEVFARVGERDAPSVRSA